MGKKQFELQSATSFKTLEVDVVYTRVKDRPNYRRKQLRLTTVYGTRRQATIMLDREALERLLGELDD